MKQPITTLLLAAALQACAQPAEPPGWWQQLDDPLLDHLVAAAPAAPLARRGSAATEVAGLYVELRACQALQRLETEGQPAPWQATPLGLRPVAGRAGPSGPDCEAQWALLAGAAGRPLPQLRTELAASAGRMPQLPGLALQEVPAQALAQRADLQGAEREVLAAGTALRQLLGQPVPGILLQGRIAVSWLQAGAGAPGLWSGGEVAAVLPLFGDEAQQQALRAAGQRCEQALAAYQARLQVAVLEVQDALAALHRSAASAAQAQAVAEHLQRNRASLQARQPWRLAGWNELEDARQAELQARGALITHQRDQLQAWIALHAALGGATGWTGSGAELLVSIGQG